MEFFHVEDLEGSTRNMLLAFPGGGETGLTYLIRSPCKCSSWLLIPGIKTIQLCEIKVFMELGLKLSEQQLQSGQKTEFWLPVMGKIVLFESHILKEAKCNFSNKQTGETMIDFQI